MVCMTCAPESMDTLDLCSNPECLSATVGLDDRPDLTSPHVPSHDFYQLRKTMHARERQQYDAQAREAVRKAHAILNEVDAFQCEDPDSVDSGPRDERPTCLSCGDSVMRPCWYCTECDGAYSRI